MKSVLKVAFAVCVMLSLCLAPSTVTKLLAYNQMYFKLTEPIASL